MKFAVIEYTSKTGQIWRHTPEHPNYLADPQKELDPTSFGCYVSALEGEHIPMTALIQPTIGKRLYQKVTGRWPKYDISYLQKFDVILMVFQSSNSAEIIRLTERIRQELPHVKIFGVPTQTFGAIKEQWAKNPALLAQWQQFARACHVFITVVKSTKAEWETVLRAGGAAGAAPPSPSRYSLRKGRGKAVPGPANVGEIRVEYIPQPYPVEFAAQFFKPRSQKKKIIFVAGRTDRDDIPKGLRVAKQLQSEFPDYVIHVTKIDEAEVKFDISALEGANHEVRPFEQWREHLPYLADVAFVINTDYTSTRGRVQVDCAAVGTVSIGADSDGQMDLFSKFPGSRSQSVEDLVVEGRRLLTDDALYAATVEHAKGQLLKYNYTESATRINALFASL